MKPSACEMSGVPTTPRPQKAAPSPRYNDITRPRALRMGADGALQQTPQAGSTRSRFWDSSGGDERLTADEPSPFFPGSSSSAAPFKHASDFDFPSPWQGKIALPDSDQETVNTAQAWIAQILGDSGKGTNGGVAFSDDLLANGRVLCQVANAISSGAVEVILKGESDASNVSNMRSFLYACQKFGVPAGALFDVDDRDPARIGLCLHVLSRVVRDTVPGFPGPFLSESDHPSPCGGGSNNSNSTSSSAGDDTSTGSSTTRRVDDNDGYDRENLLQGTCSNNYSALASSDNPDKINEPPHRLGEEGHRHRGGQRSFSSEEGQQATPTSHARCAPPAHPAPSPFEQEPLLWPLNPPTVRGVFETPQGSSGEGHPPAPQRRPLSLPSRLSRTVSAGGASLNGNPPVNYNWADTTIWDNVFETKGDATDSGRKFDARATWAPPSTKRYGRAFPEQGGQVERNNGQVTLDSLSQPTAATSEEKLSSWLANLNLGSFAQELANIGVEVMGDLRYVEEKDLSDIGMHGPQIRKLLQNRP